MRVDFEDASDTGKARLKVTKQSAYFEEKKKLPNVENNKIVAELPNLESNDCCTDCDEKDSKII